MPQDYEICRVGPGLRNMSCGAGVMKNIIKQRNNKLNQENHVNTLRPRLYGEDPLTTIRPPQRSLSSQPLGRY